MLYRKAKMADVPHIQALVNGYAEDGLMLPRPLSMIYENLRDIVVVEAEGRILGTGALHLVWDDLAELRAMAVVRDAVGQGLGRKMVDFLLGEARELGVSKIFALTYQPHFFEKCGFTVVAKETLPQKVWKECINCPKFPNCDEVALTIELKG